MPPSVGAERSPRHAAGAAPAVVSILQMTAGIALGSVRGSDLPRAARWELRSQSLRQRNCRAPRPRPRTRSKKKAHIVLDAGARAGGPALTRWVTRPPWPLKASPARQWKGGHQRSHETAARARRTAHPRKERLSAVGAPGHAGGTAAARLAGLPRTHEEWPTPRLRPSAKGGRCSATVRRDPPLTAQRSPPIADGTQRETARR